jgi:surface antigen
MSDDLFQRRTNAKLRDLEGRPKLIKGEITATSPLTLELGGSGNPIPGVRALSSANLTVGDMVWALKWPGDLLILGTLTDAPGAGWGTWHSYPRANAASSVAATANLLYFAQVKVPGHCTLTGIGYLVGTVQSGNVKAGLFNAAGTRVASTTATVAQAAPASHQKVAFSSPYEAAPGIYYLALVFSSSTATAFAGVANCPSGSAAQGSHTVGSSITVPTSVAVVNVPNMTSY